MQTALVVKELRSEFAGPFDLNLGAGACAAITGPSGSGKSLFLRMIADLDPNEGKVWLNGAERASIVAPEWRRKVTYVSAESGWWADTVIEHFARNKRSEVAGLAARLGLSRRSSRRIDRAAIHRREATPGAGQGASAVPARFASG
jgi:ABC-type iron transport system FetAB ATPase subunit